MPAQDRTGPLGQGPLTGRGLGPCSQGIFGFRRGFERGFGRGFRRFTQIPLATPITNEPLVLTQQEEKQILETNLKDLKSEIQAIEKRLKELK
jgi:hypothetical protein